MASLITAHYTFPLTLHLVHVRYRRPHVKTAEYIYDSIYCRMSQLKCIVRKNLILVEAFQPLSPH